MNGDHAGVFVPPPLLFLAPLVGAFILNRQRPWPIAADNATILLLGAFIAVATGVSVGLASVHSFRQAKTTILPAGRPTTAVVDRGPYRVTRNPMYVAMALGYVGLSLLLNNLWAIVLLPVVIAVIDVFVIRREERYLSNKFGQDYRDYCSRVRRWL